MTRRALPPARTRAVRRAALLPAGAILLVGVSLLAACARPPAHALAEDIALPIDVADHVAYLMVQVNGSRPLPFILDTGSEAALIDLGVARSLGLDLRGTLPIAGDGAGREAGRFVRDAAYTLAGLPGFSGPVRYALPLDRPAKVAGHEFAGILGWDFLAGFVVEIDYLGQRVILHDRDRFRYSGAGEVLPLAFGSDKHPRLTAEVVLDGERAIQGTFVIDTGASAPLSFSTPFVQRERLLETHPSPLRRIVSQGAGGKVEGSVGRIPRLRLGALTVESPIATFSTMSAGAFAAPDVAGHIGGAVLEKLRVFLDYGRARIILEPNSRFREPMEYDMSGLGLLGEGEDFRHPVVEEVYPDTPAAEAGLRRGDVIVALDGHSAAAALSLSAIREAFRREGAVTLTLRRGDARLEVTLRLRRLV